MHTFSLVSLWIFLISSWLQELYATTNKESSDVKVFFDQIERVMDRLLVESKSGVTDQKSDSRKLRYLIPETLADREREEDRTYSRRNRLEAVNNLLPRGQGPFYNLNDADGRNAVVDFEGYQEFVFRPLYPCDSYDSTQRHCILRRQLGTTLTLGVQVGEGLHSGMRIYWSRCLRKKYFNHIIKEPLNKGFLPWNLNLGGSSNELRISPITDMDLSYNYFLAELVTPQTSSGKYTHKPSIRFYIESIEIDMGSLYHGEEIVIYARSFMELPRTSVNFLWSIQEKNNFEDHDLPSNMQLNADKSSVIIKELKTYQDQHLVCKVFSNKDFFLAKRTFLFRGFGQNKTNASSNAVRLKRYVEDLEQRYEESNQLPFEETDALPNVVKPYTYSATNEYHHYTESEVPEISDLLYNNDRKDVAKFQDSNYNHLPLLSQNAMSRIMRRLIQRDESTNRKSYRTKYEKHRFEDTESQMIAACKTHNDCNIRGTCVRESNYEQSYCKCPHSFNGNGLFCFNT